MLNVSQAVKQAYTNGNPETETFITVGNVTYDPTNILAGSVSIVESICSAEQFSLNRVEKNSITFTLFNITENISDLQGKHVSANQTITVGETSTDIPLGEYVVVDAVNDGDYLIKCVAYDSATLAMDASADAWWNTEITFPISVKNLMISLFTKIGVSYSLPADFTNSGFTISQRPVFVEGVTYADIVGYIQEVIAGFLKPNRYGVIHLYKRVQRDGFYPKEGRYPATGLYPKQSTVVNTFADESTVGEQRYNYRQIVSGLVISDFTTQTIERVQVRGTADDIGIIVGQGTNTYVIEANPLLYGLTDESGRPVVQNIYNEITGLTYIPFRGRFTAFPYMETGDMVVVSTYNGLHVESPVFKRTMSGSRLAFDELETNGVEELEQVEEVNRTITVLRQKTHEIVNTVDELTSTMTEVVTSVEDLDEDVSDLSETVTTHTSQISQNAQAITTKVSTTDYNGNSIASLINQTATTVQIQASKINLTGYVTFTSLQNKQSSTFIDGGNIKTSSLSASTIYGGTLTLGGANNVNGVLNIKNASNQIIGVWNKDGIQITGGTITSPVISAGDMYWYKGTTNEARLSGATVYGNISNGIVLVSNAFQLKIGDRFVVTDKSNSVPYLYVRTDGSYLRIGGSGTKPQIGVNTSRAYVEYGNAYLRADSSDNVNVGGSRITLSGSTKVQLARGNTYVNLDGNASYLEYNNGYRQAIVAVHNNLAYLYAYNNGSQYAGIEANASGGLYVHTQIHGGWYSKRRVEWREIVDVNGNHIYALCEA